MSYINRRGVNTSTRKMTTRQQISDVFSYGYIITTKSRGKLTQRYLERMITLSKRGTLADRRRVASVILRTSKYEKDQLLNKIFTDIAKKYKDRNGGCTRLLKLQEKDRVVLSLV
ncbi:50S ribosomal protein L17 [Candidatus Mycoplasma haematohominis]|uniref:50S ribosomal protein L17 n=1 Tax=Candidatus Mycoplasma haematohominis TaxID=1494318 RepID=A0A478FQZ1_9MOLU|nr:50S ribosomal protein L17 [Candidatus Mycoplasma haemohominis]